MTNGSIPNMSTVQASFGVLGVPVCDNLLDASATAMLKIAVDKRAAADRPIMLTRGVRPSMLRLSLPMGTAGSIGWQYKPPAGQHGVQPALDGAYNDLCTNSTIQPYK